MRLNENGGIEVGSGGGGAGGAAPSPSAPSPASAPASSAPSASATPSQSSAPEADDSDSFGFIPSDIVDGGVYDKKGNQVGSELTELQGGGFAQAPAAPTTPQPTGQQPTPAPQQVQQVQQPQATVPAPAPQAPQPQAPQAAQPGRQAPQRQPSPLEVITANQAALIDHVAKEGLFTLSAEDVALLDSDPAAAMQRAMARTYVTTTAYIHTMLEKVLPQRIAAMFESFSGARDQQQTMSRRAEELMKTQYPGVDTNNPAHRAALMQFGRAFAMANPQATLEQRVKGVGAMLQVALGLPPAGASQARPAAPQTTRTGFAPAVGGAPPPPVVVNDPFGGMHRDFDGS